MRSSIFLSSVHASLQAAGGGERGDEGRQRKVIKTQVFRTASRTHGRPTGLMCLQGPSGKTRSHVSLFIRTPRLHEGACTLSPCSAASVSINIKDLHMGSSDNIISGCGLWSLWQRNATLCPYPLFY